MPFAQTPEPPYTAVIFTSTRTAGDNGYGVMAARMEELAAQQPGYLGIDSARDGLGTAKSSPPVILKSSPGFPRVIHGYECRFGALCMTTVC